MNIRTVNYLDNGDIELIEESLNDPGEHEVQIRRAACGICSWDIATCRAGSAFPVPAPAGHEGMGYIEKVGSKVTTLNEGDRVLGGGFATYFNMAAEHVHTLPDNDVADEFFLVEPVSCVVNGLDHCRLKAGDKVAMIGAGYMGFMMIQALKGNPFLSRFDVIDINDDRLKLAKELGAFETYNSLNDDLDELKSLKYDVVIDTSGSQQGLDLATDLTRRGGIINLFGWLKGETAFFDPTKWHLGGFTVINSAPASGIRDVSPVAIDLISRGIIDMKPLVTHIVSLDEYPDLMKTILAGDSSYIKGVVK
ncbi:MAG: zinc-binding dehydrogenase [Lentisphaeria bacterium]|nr:zinc-binding dehydrogenase [Lentisphaeria bacterium]NQZ68621.1 zinc-binding dehydrogenase [Lentisphaeria bacterium]